MTVFQGRLAYVPAKHSVELQDRTWQIEHADDVLIEVYASSLCGSDYHIYNADHPSAPLPMWLGHEAAGIVVAHGKNVTQVSVGDRVVIEPNIICGTCDACRAGTYNLCESLTFAYRIGDGAMSDYIRVKERNVHLLPDALSFKEGALIEPLAVAVHACKQADIKAGQSVLVIGGGPIGILIAAVAKKQGASWVTLSDPHTFRHEMAKAFGVDEVVGRNAPDVSMVDVCFDCAGAENSINRAIELVKPGGTICLVGLISGSKNVKLTRVVASELHVVGTQGYCHDFPTSLALATQLDLARLITHEFPLAAIDQALRTGMDRSADSIKVLILKE